MSNRANPTNTAIQIRPSPEKADEIAKMAKQLRTSKGGLCQIAIEFVIPKIISGEMVVVNGRLCPSHPKAA